MGGDSTPTPFRRAPPFPGTGPARRWVRLNPAELGSSYPDAYTSCRRRFSSASGFGGRPRFAATPSVRCFRQLLMSELYTPFARRIVARSIGELANSYSLKIRALSSAVKRRCFSRTLDSGSEDIGIHYLPLCDFPGSAGFTHHRHIRQVSKSPKARESPKRSSTRPTAMIARSTNACALNRFHASVWNRDARCSLATVLAGS